MIIVFILLITYQIKHFVVDYLLQNSYMLGKYDKTGWVWPLAAHASMHGIATLIITLMVGVGPIGALIFAFYDFTVHGLIDKLKVESSRGLEPSEDKEFWWWLGADQMVHHLTHYFIIFLVLHELGIV